MGVVPRYPFGGGAPGTTLCTAEGRSGAAPGVDGSAAGATERFSQTDGSVAVGGAVEAHDGRGRQEQGAYAGVALDLDDLPCVGHAKEKAEAR